MVKSLNFAVSFFKLECKNPLGLTTGAIEDSFIKSSYSYIPGSSEPNCVNETQARLYAESTGYWCTDKTQPTGTAENPEQWTLWLQVHFPKTSIIKGLAVQGLQDDKRIDKFVLAFATDESDFQYYIESSNIKVKDSTHYSWLSEGSIQNHVPSISLPL